MVLKCGWSVECIQCCSLGQQHQSGWHVGAPHEKLPTLVGGIEKGFDKCQTRYCVKLRCYCLEAMQAVPNVVLWNLRQMYILREICVSVSQFTNSWILSNYKSRAPLQAICQRLLNLLTWNHIKVHTWMCLEILQKYKLCITPYYEMTITFIIIFFSGPSIPLPLRLKP